MISGTDIAAALARAFSTAKAGEKGFRSFKPRASQQQARTVRDLIELYRKGRMPRLEEHDQGYEDGDHGGGFEFRIVTAERLDDEWLSPTRFGKPRIGGAPRRWTAPPIVLGELPARSKRPQAPPAEGKAGDYRTIVPLAAAGFDLARKRGLAIDVDQKADDSQWAVMVWLRLELERCGFEWDLCFNEQLSAEMEGEEEQPYDRAMVPLYIAPVWDESVPLLELLEAIRKVLCRQWRPGELNLPEQASVVVTDVAAGGAVLMKAKQQRYTDAEVRQAEKELLRIVFDAGACATRLPPLWARAIEALRPHAWPKVFGPILVDDHWDAMVEIGTAAKLEKFLERCMDVGELRRSTDPLVVRYDDGVDKFWQEFVDSLLGRRPRPLIEVLGDGGEGTGGPTKPKRTKRL